MVKQEIEVRQTILRSKIVTVSIAGVLTTLTALTPYKYLSN